MRNIFFALVLANLAFAAWHSWFAAEPIRSSVGAPATRGITLAVEVDSSVVVAAAGPTGADGPVPVAAPTLAPSTVAPDVIAPDVIAPDVVADAPDNAAVTENAQLPAAVAATAAVEPAESAMLDRGNQRCVSVGPFRELSQAATAAATLRASGFSPTQRAGEGDVWVGYWVYIGQIPSVEEAELVLSVLKQNDIDDSYVIPQSDSGTIVSLGVFTEIARAGNRREAASELGFDTTIADRTRRATVYWIDVFLEPGQLIDFEQLQPRGRIIRLEQVSCDEVPA